VTGAHCVQCGAVIGPGAQFCMKCGHDVSGQQVGVATRMVGGEVTEERSRPRLSQADLLSRLRDATLGEYEVLAELGRGGMATVYLAHDIQLDRKVAIKVLNPSASGAEEMVERFRLEARTAAKLSHPHIIPIHAVRETEELVFFVMKFVVGRPLDTIIKQLAPLPNPTVRTILTRVAEALGYAHRNGVVHRDIKPANIMIDAEGMPIVTDFGIAKVADRRGLTMTGTAIGTPTYMSPEQCNAGSVTGASDQYSLGVMAFEMLTGRTLYEGESLVTVMFKHCHEAPPAPEAFGPSVPADLVQAVIRMLQKNPADRWPAMEDALPSLRGGDASLDDSVRTQMIEFAKGGTQAALLARLSTPRSPIPVRFASGAPSGARSAAGAKGEAGARPAQRSRALSIAAAVLVLAGAGTLAVLQPWRSRGIVPVTDPGVAVASPPAPTVPQDTAVGTIPPAASDVAPTTAGTPLPSTPEARPVPAPVVREVRILDAPTTLPEGQAAALRAAVLDQRGGTLLRPVRWSSSNAAVATVGGDGRLSTVAAGTATITAEVDGRTAQVAISVTPVVASVVVEPGSGSLRPGDALALGATPRGRDGAALAGYAVTWRSSDERVAVVSTTGRVTAIGAGTAVINATSEGQVGSARITVAAPAVTVPVEAPPPAAVESPQEEVTRVVDAYASALEAKDLNRVKALHPGISAALERRTRDALEAMDELRVVLRPSNIAVTGTSARARVTGTWTYRGGRLDVDNQYVFERRASGWVIISIE